MDSRERLKGIVRMRAHGSTLQEIGDAYGLTRERIRQLLRCEAGAEANKARLSLLAQRKQERLAARRRARDARRSLTPDQVREMREAYAAGEMTQCQLAEKYGVVQNHVSNIVRGRDQRGGSYYLDAGGPLTHHGRGGKLTAADVAVIRAEYAAGGVSQTALAAKFGVSVGMVQQIVAGTAWKNA